MSIWYMARHVDGDISGHNVTADYRVYRDTLVLGRVDTLPHSPGTRFAITHDVLVEAATYEEAQTAARQVFAEDTAAEISRSQADNEGV